MSITRSTAPPKRRRRRLLAALAAAGVLSAVGPAAAVAHSEHPHHGDSHPHHGDAHPGHHGGNDSNGTIGHGGNP